jgi:sulfane dehydrogenase subunit SoxC
MKTTKIHSVIPTYQRLGRRGFLGLGAAVATGLAGTPARARDLGAPRRAYGERAATEKSERVFAPGATPGTGASRTPLQDQLGIITPSSLHFERHHSGVPQIDPATHTLMVHGLVERPLVLTMEQIRRLPSTSRIHFIECAGNTAMDHMGQPGTNPQRSHGLLSCSEWTGVPLKVLLDEVGVKAGARWVLAEGGDPARLNRSIPLDKALDDVLVVYGQNGEALRPEQGYPLRLLVPGWEGNVSIKWLSRLELVNQPYMTRDEAAFYTDLMPDGRARRFSFVMEAKSVITRPAGEQQLDGPGYYDITGFAWSGRGAITRVEVSTDDGTTWADAELAGPVLAKALTRFRLPWRWDGKPTSLRSRCTDDTGYVQPTREQLLAVRGQFATDHYNGIKVWYVKEDGKVSHV